MSNARNLANLLSPGATGIVAPMVTLTATTSITANAHAGRTLLMGEVGGDAACTFTLPAATGTLIGTGDTGTLPLAAMDIDGGTDIGGALETTDLIIVDDGAGGTNRKAALSRVVTLMTAQGFSTDDPTALAIALG